MALRTQVDPHVLIGDTLSDLPSPGNIPQGTLFHELATGACRVLVENPSNHVRTWEEFCAAVTGATGATGPTGPTGPTGVTGATGATGATGGAFQDLVFSGSSTAGGSVLLANGATGSAGGTPGFEYPVLITGANVTFQVHVVTNAVTTAGSSVTLTRNGSTIPGTNLPIAVSPFTGNLALTTVAQAFVPGDRIGVDLANGTVGAEALQITASVRVS